MQQSLIMYENADNRAPDDYMELVLKDYNTCWAMLTIDLATAKNDSISGYDKSPDMETIKQGRELCSDPPVHIAYWFHKDDKEVHPDSMQPFVIVKDKEENPLVVALAAGEFKDYSGDGGISNASYYAVEYLHSQFEDLMERVGGDIEKLDAELSKKNNMNNLRNSLGDGDYLILALADEKGSIHVISKSALNATDWGFTSDTLGWGQTTDTTAEDAINPTAGSQGSKEEPGKELTGMAKRLANRNARKTANLGPTEKPTATASVSSFIPKPTIIVNKTQDRPDMGSPPKGATIDTHPHWYYQLNPERGKNMKDRQIRQAYQNAVGFVPQNYLDFPVVQRKTPLSIKDMNITNEPLKDFSGLKQIASVTPAKGEGPPLITAMSLKHINEEILPKYYDVDKRIIKDPWKAPYVEAKMAMFSDVTGLGDALYGAPTQLRRDLITNPDAFINWTIEMSDTIIRQRAEINGLRDRIAEFSARHLKSS